MRNRALLGLIIGCALCVISFGMTSKANECTNVNIGVESDGTVSTLQEKEEAAIEKYNKLLTEWSKDKPVVSDINADFPDFYGGAYINDNKDLVIQVTENSSEVIDYFSNRVGSSGIVFEEVEYSFKRLLSEKAAIEKQVFEKDNNLSLSTAEGIKEVNISGIGLSLRNNSISVYIDETEANSKSLINEETVKQSFFSFENIVIVKQKTSTKKVGVEEDDNETLGIRALSTLRPGQRINAAGSRSVGFWAKKTNGDIGIVTAPHDNLSSGTSVYLTDGTRFGSTQTPHFGGSVDAVFVKTTRTDLTISNKPAGYNFNIASETYRTLPEGATVYASGYVSGAKTGVVSDSSFSTNVTGSNYTNYYFTDLVKVTMGTAQGDSGGIVAGGGNSASRYVVGIIQSGDNWGAETLYVKMPNISVALGILVY